MGVEVWLLTCLHLALALHLIPGDLQEWLSMHNLADMVGCNRNVSRMTTIISTIAQQRRYSAVHRLPCGWWRAWTQMFAFGLPSPFVI